MLKEDPPALSRRPEPPALSRHCGGLETEGVTLEANRRTLLSLGIHDAAGHQPVAPWSSGGEEAAGLCPVYYYTACGSQGLVFCHSLDGRSPLADRKERGRKKKKSRAILACTR